MKLLVALYQSLKSFPYLLFFIFSNLFFVKFCFQHFYYYHYNDDNVLFFYCSCLGLKLFGQKKNPKQFIAPMKMRKIIHDKRNDAFLFILLREKKNTSSIFISPQTVNGVKKNNFFFCFVLIVNFGFLYSDILCRITFCYKYFLAFKFLA